ncbi:MAG: DUF4173 domain-containing protein [Spirosomaceae bacterium]|nr:DUF4173 domain-containing protein [Spirosomataceae bacterium]
MIAHKSYWLWAAVVAAYTYLFYDQEIAGNTLVLAPLVLLLLGFQSPHLFKMRYFRWAALAYLTSAVAVAWHDYPWAVLSHFVAGLILMGCCYQPRSSIFISFFNGLLSALLVSFVQHFGHFVRILTQFFGRFFNFRLLTKAWLFVIPTLVTSFFYWLYHLANPDFVINLTWFEFDFQVNYPLFFTILWGMIWLTPFFFPWGIASITKRDLAKPEDLIRQNTNPRKLKRSITGFLNEYRQGVILFAMLNVLISAFLVLGVWQIFHPTQKGYSEQVHEGFFTLIVSILMAVVLILYFFRGNQNFYTRNHRLKQLAFVWILLNVLLAVFTLYKNSDYVAAYGLTFKRIGVYWGMLMTLIGLGFTFWKIKYLKTNWYLIHTNAWILFGALVVNSLVDWNRVIVFYNLRYAQHIDFAYLHGLDATAVPPLVAYDATLQKTPAHLRPQGYKPYPISGIRYLFKSTDWRSQTFDQRRLRAFWEEKDKQRRVGLK